jgi:hypothetical protein
MRGARLNVSAARIDLNLKEWNALCSDQVASK